MNKNRLITIILSFSLLIGSFGVDNSFGRGSSGSSFSGSTSGSKSSFSGSSSKWGSSSSSGSKWGNSSSTSVSTPTKNWGTSSNSTAPSNNKNWSNTAPNFSGNRNSVVNSSSTDASLGRKVNQSATGKTRGDYINKFENNRANQAKYKTTFDREPSVRPSYVPNSYIDPTYHTYHYVYYNPGFMGYGYYDYFGNWVFYNAVHDIAMSQAMSAPPVYYAPHHFGVIGIASSVMVSMIIVAALIFFLI